MSRHLGSRSQEIAMALAFVLGLLWPSAVAFAGPGADAASAGETAPASPNPVAPATASPAADLALPVEVELAELKDAVQSHMKQFDEYSKELETQRAALQDELARIASLEARLGTTPGATPETLP